ncbi:MAG: ribonuclease HII [Chlamydiota bacterium]
MTPPQQSSSLPLTSFEDEARQQGFLRIAGVDEVGRGPLAGPVVAAACIVPEGMVLHGVGDSKKLTPRCRKEVFQDIKDNPHINWGIGVVSHQIIDEINILQATIRAMQIAVEALDDPHFLLVDGTVDLSHLSVPSRSIIKGDSLSQSIAAASIIAKEIRDSIMEEYHHRWPYYDFIKHKGYPTKKHREMLEQYGPSSIHRKSFQPVKSIAKRSLL